MVKLNTQSFQRLGKKVIKLGKRAAPAVLIVFGMGAAWNSGFQAGKNKPKADELIAKKKEELGVEKLSVVETVKTTAPVYWPAAVSGVVAVASTGAGIGFEEMRVSTATAALNTITKEFNTYKEESQKVMNEEQSKQVEDLVAEKTVKTASKPGKKILSKRVEEDVLVCEALTGQWFVSNRSDIMAAVNEFNQRLNSEMYLSLNDWLDVLSEYSRSEINRAKVMGDEFGWNSPRSGLLKPSFSAQLTEEGDPCLVLDYARCPVEDYDSI